MKTSKRTLSRTQPELLPRRVSWILFIALAMIFPATIFASLDKLGAMGDSLTDEYWDTATPVSTYATNWVQLLVVYRGIDMGATAGQAGVGTWGEPRNTGFKYNWARGGAATATLLTQGQHTGVAGEASSNGVRNAVLAVGPNDFTAGNVYQDIYNGSWTAAQIQSYVAQSISNIETALATVRAAGVSVVMANVLDIGPTPRFSKYFPSAANRARVTAVVRSLNSGLKNLAQKYQVPLMDWFALETAIFGSNTNVRSTLTLGNVTINLRASDPGPPNSRPTSMFVSDGFHPNTVFQGMLANAILQAFNSGYGAGVPLFSEQELLNQAGIPYGGSDTLQAEIGSFTNYIDLPVLPRITSLTVAGANVTLNFSAVSNQTYIVEGRDDLVAGSWTTVSSNVAGTGGIVMLTNQVPANLPERFYRVRQLP